VYDWLLFLHVLSAFALVVTVVIFSAFALGAATDSRVLAVANAGWAVGGLGTLVLGIWLALYVDGYEIWDGWILAAIVLWAIATELGRRARDIAVANVATWHWLRTLAVLLLLADMVWKPGA
jgi:hypothetical protein